MAENKDRALGSAPASATTATDGKTGVRKIIVDDEAPRKKRRR